MKRNLSLIIMMMSSLSCFSQVRIDGQVLDKDTRTPLPYCNVGILHTTIGTITNAEGKYTLDTKKLSDTLACSFIGYRPFRIVVSELVPDGEIYLGKSSVSLQTTTILSNSFLYDVVANCKKANNPHSYTAKTYFELDSYMEDRPVEMLECYYNGNYYGTHVESLNLKAGKIYLADYEKRYFTNLETSKVVSSLKLYTHNDYFPAQPFELGLSALKKKYHLKLLEKDWQNGTKYLVGFQPTAEDRKYFSGQAWIDSATNDILQINLQINDAAVYPFIPLWTYDTIVSVDLDITESFKKIDGKMYVDVIDFTYHMKYRNREEITTNIHTNCVLHMYDMKRTFILPFYEYNANQSDYRKISSFPNNDFFWKNRDSIVTSEKRKENRQYFERKGMQLTYNMPGYFNNAFFKDNIIRWNPSKRLHIKEIADSSYQNEGSNLPSSMYKLKANIFVDVDPDGNGWNITTHTLFDVFDSYYRLPMDSTTDCFANIYFDILENERRELEAEINKPNLSLELIKNIYRNRLLHVGQTTQRYFREVEHGQNKDALAKWNEYVKERLRIDNMALFHLDKSR